MAAQRTALLPGLHLSRIFICAALFGGMFELLHAETSTTRRLEFREPQATTYIVGAAQRRGGATATKAASRAGDSWTVATIEGTTNKVQLGDRVVLQLESGEALDRLLAGRNLTLSRTICSNLFILQAPDSELAIDAAEKLAKLEGVIASHPVMRRPLKRRNVYSKAPDDPLFPEQWHLENRGTNYQRAGPDLNVRAAWPLSKGDNILVAVADDGFQLDHPELAKRASTQPHYNFYENIANGGPGSSNASHATAVAGLIAAEGNNSRGVTGVAPEAYMASWVIFGNSFGQEDIANDEQLMDMFQHASNRVSVQNHSWGSATTSQLPIDLLANLAISNAVKLGRAGKGVVIVRAGGNEREELGNGNDDGWICCASR